MVRPAGPDPWSTSIFVIRLASVALALAAADWAWHLGLSPGRQMDLAALAIQLTRDTLRGSDEITGDTNTAIVGRYFGRYSRDFVTFYGSYRCDPTGRWAGVSISQVPMAPVEHGRPLRQPDRAGSIARHQQPQGFAAALEPFQDDSGVHIGGRVPGRRCC